VALLDNKDDRLKRLTVTEQGLENQKRYTTLNNTPKNGVCISIGNSRNFQQVSVLISTARLMNSNGPPFHKSSYIGLIINPDSNPDLLSSDVV